MLAQIRHFQQAFEQLAEKYPDGYSGENLKVSYRAGRDGEMALGFVLWPTFSNFIQNFDPEGKILSPDEIRDFLKQHPDARLILAFRGTNVVYFKRPNKPMSTRFYPNPASWIAVFSYDSRFSQMRVEELVPLDEGGELLLKTQDAVPWTLVGGTLPTKQQNAYRRWTDWQIEGCLLLSDNTLSPIGGFVGHTKWSKKSEKSGYGDLDGWVKVLTPEKMELLSDADVLSLLNGEQK